MSTTTITTLTTFAKPPRHIKGDTGFALFDAACKHYLAFGHGGIGFIKRTRITEFGREAYMADTEEKASHVKRILAKGGIAVQVVKILYS